MIQNILDQYGNVIGTLTLPDNTIQSVWNEQLSIYSNPTPISCPPTTSISNGGTGASSTTGARLNLGIDSGASLLLSGTSYTTPNYITTSTLFKFTLVGGGGGGGGGGTTTATTGTGGGGAACGILFISALTPTTNYVVSIGAPGAGGNGDISSPTAGNNGGSTTISINGTTYTAGGGSGGLAGSSAKGGACGIVSGFTVNLAGQNGNGSTNATKEVGSMGGNSGGGWGLGGSATSNNIPQPGTGYGSGGAGGWQSNGGNGSQGMILVEFYN